jgi:hypothetical protein
MFFTCDDALIAKTKAEVKDLMVTGPKAGS